MLHIYYGDGKGKTTASVGLAVRATGAGLATSIHFFDKGGNNYAERAGLQQLGIGVHVSGRDRIDAAGRFDFSILPEDRQMALDGLAVAAAEIQKLPKGLVVLDEALNCIRLKMLTEQEVLDAVAPAIGSAELDVVLTGRGLPDEIAERADLITEMKLRKHYFEIGQQSRSGIEY